MTLEIRTGMNETWLVQKCYIELTCIIYIENKVFYIIIYVAGLVCIVLC